MNVDPGVTAGAGTPPLKCQACNRPMDSPLFCGGCQALYPAEGFNHFELLGLTPGYELDLTELRRRYLQASRQVHPDQRAAAEAGGSLRASARLNEAYRVLADPLLRAEYLLELSGGKSSAEDKSVPQEVLTQSLMLREEVEEARAAHDAAALDFVRRQTRKLYDASLHEVAALARALPGTDETRRELRLRLNAVKYHQKLLGQL